MGELSYECNEDWCPEHPGDDANGQFARLQRHAGRDVGPNEDEGTESGGRWEKMAVDWTGDSSCDVGGGEPYESDPAGK